MSTKQFRIGDAAGPDYGCHLCGVQGYRMWRMAASSCVELTCAVCSETQEAETIARYSQHPRDSDPAIGNLVPARRDPEDAHWWGSTSGDVDWWYAMPQYADPAREAEVRTREAAAAKWAELRRVTRAARL